MSKELEQFQWQMGATYLMKLILLEIEKDGTISAELHKLKLLNSKEVWDAY